MKTLTEKNLIKSKLLGATATGAVLALLISAGAVAMPPEEKEPNFERMASKLQLDETQTESFVTIMKEAFQERKAARDAAESKVRSQLSGVLTEEQLAKLEEMHERRKAHRGGKGGKKDRHCDQDQ